MNSATTFSQLPEVVDYSQHFIFQFFFIILDNITDVLDDKTSNLIQPQNSSLAKGPNWLKIAKYGGTSVIVGGGLYFGGKWLYKKINNWTNEQSK